MNHQLLRQKIDCIIKGLECMASPEDEQEFLNLLDDFTIHMIDKCKSKIAEQKARLN